MLSRRWRVIVLGIVLAAIGAAIPLATAGWMSWQVARAKEIDLLTLAARAGLARAELTFSQSRGAMNALAPTHLSPCSESHIAEMRMATVNAPSVEEVGYIEDGKIKCTSWGPLEDAIARSGYDTTVDGMGVSIRMAPSVTQGNPMTALHLGNYNTLVMPSRFLDVPVQDSIGLALMTEAGQSIYARNGPDLTIAAALVDASASGFFAGHLYASVKEDGLVVVALESQSAMAGEIWRQVAIFLPIGVFVALFILGLTYWLSKQRLSPKAELESAVRNREFIVHFQPIVELATGVCFGAEALVRWQRPDGTLVRPDLFIPLAEETGLIIPITDQVVEAVIAELGSLLVSDRTLHIAINLCADDISSGRILDFLEQRLRNTGINNQQIWLEATERGFIDIEAARVTLKRARDAGHAVAIDDFGTGYSSLQYLEGLPLDALKIDKSFVDTIGKNSATSSVVLHIIAMAQELGLFSVAEGVETEEQAAYLRDKGVGFAQGWLFSKPLPAKQFREFHATSKAKFGDAPELVSITRS